MEDIPFGVDATFKRDGIVVLNFCNMSSLSSNELGM